jgi:hypothetical protein
MPEETLQEKPMRLSQALESDAPNDSGVVRLATLENPTNVQYAELHYPESVASQKKRGIWEQTRFFLGEAVIKPAVRGVKRLPTAPENLWQVGIDNIRDTISKQLAADGAVFGISEEEFKNRTPQQQMRIDNNNKLIERLNRAEDVSVRLEKHWNEIAEKGFTKRDPSVWQGSFMQNPSWTRAVGLGMESAPMLGIAAAVSFATRRPTIGATLVTLPEAAEQRGEAREAGLSVDQSNTIFVLDAMMLMVTESIPLAGFLKGGVLPARALRGFVQEGGEEVAQGLWSNSVAIIGYDDTRDLTQGLIESFIAGGISGATVGALSPSRVAIIEANIENARAKGVDVDAMFEAIGEMVTKNADAITENFFDKMTSERGELSFSRKEIESGTPFKSNLLAITESKIPNNVTPDQALKTIQNSGMSKEEIDFSGLAEFLQSKDTFTKQEIAQFVESNKVKVEVVVLSDTPQTLKMSELQRGVNAVSISYDYVVSQLGGEKPYISGQPPTWTYKKDDVPTPVPENYHGALDKYSEAVSNLEEFKNNLEDEYFGTAETKYSNYTLPGGENYQEVLVKLPKKEYIPTKSFLEVRTKGSGFGVWDITNEEWTSPTLNENVANQERDRQLKFFVRIGENFHSSHFDESNVLVHLRTNDRTTADGKKVLFIEEIQSDWHAKGKKEGYAKENPIKKPPLSTEGFEVEELNEEFVVEIEGFDPVYVSKNFVSEPQDAAEYARGILQRNWNMQNEKGWGKVPNAPFKNTWHELALKQAIEMAVKGGYDGVAFINGQQTADRYSLSKEINNIKWQKSGNGRKQVIIVPKEHGNIEIDLSTEGKILAISHTGDKTWIGKTLEDVVGKAIAEEIDDANGGNIEGVDLDIGGEWAFRFYDDMLPQAAQKYIKKWGGNIEDIGITLETTANIPGAGEMPAIQNTKQKGFLITPTMKKEVLAVGQPLFGNRLAGSGFEKLMEKRGQAGVPESEPLPDDLERKPLIFDALGGQGSVEYKPNANLINKQTAINAYSGTSHVPEERAQSEIKNFVRYMQSVYDNLKGRTKTSEQLKILNEEMLKFEQEYAQKNNELLRRRSGLYSSMVAGPANFPVRRMEKKNNAYYKKEQEFIHWYKSRVKFIAKKIENEKTREAGGELEVLKKRIEDAETLQDTMRKANAIIRKNISDKEKISELIKLKGIKEKAAEAFLKADFAGRKGFASFQLTNNNARIARMKERLKIMERKESLSGQETLKEYEGVQVVKNFDIDRTQIFMDSKPSQEVISDLKSSGWKWSPSNKAWQRQITNAAELSSKNILKKYFNLKKVEQTKEDIKEDQKSEIDQAYGADKPPVDPPETTFKQPEDEGWGEEDEPLKEATLRKIEKEFVDLPEAQDSKQEAEDRADFELFMNDYVKSKDTLGAAVKKHGGISPPKNSKDLEEYNEIPVEYRRKNGIPLDSMTTELAASGFYFEDGDSLREALAVNYKPYQKNLTKQTKKVLEERRLKKKEDKDKASVLKIAVKLAKKMPDSSTKGIIRKTTGQDTIELPTIKESKALKRSLKRQEQVARVASRKMKEETIQILMLRRKLRKQPIESITAQERKEINALRATIRPRMKLDELTALYAQIEAIKERGKAKYIANKAVRDAEMEAKIAVMVAIHGTPTTDQPPPITSVTVRESGGSFPQKIARFADAKTLRPFRLMDKFDGGQNFQGPHHKEFYDKANEAVQAQLVMNDARKKDILGFFKKKNIAVDSIYETIEIDGIKFTISDMMGIYAASKHSDNMLAVLYGNNIPLDTIGKIISQVENMPVYKELADLIIADFNNPENYDALNDAFIEYTDGKHELDKVKGVYVPIRRTMLGGEPTEKELASEMLERANLKKAYAQRGFTYTRENVPAEFQMPIKLDILALWNDHVDKTTHFITHANMARDWHRIINTKSFRESVLNNKALGKEFYETLERWVNRMVNPNIYKTFNQVDKVSKTLRSNAAVAYLAFNLVSMAKQFPAMTLFLGEVDAGYLLGGISDLTTNHKDTIAFIHERSAQMKHRSIERELEEMKTANYTKYIRLLRRVGLKGMKGMYLVDQYTTHSGWIGKYRQSIDEGLSEVEAAREADKSVLRTQNAAHAKDISDLYDSGEILNWFTQFTNQLNNIYGMVTWDIPQRARLGETKDAFNGIVGVSLSALLIWVISHAKFPEDKEEWLEAFTDQYISMIPFLGPMLSAKLRGSFGSQIPALSGVYKGAEAIADLTKGKYEKSASKFVEAGAVTAGVPFSQPRRTLRGTMDLISGKTYDLRRLIWSESSLGEKKSGKRGGTRYRGSF